MKKKFTLLLLAMLCIAGTSQSKEHVIFLGDHAIGNWANGLNIGKDAFSALTSGDAITIQYEPDEKAAAAASQPWYQIKMSSGGGEILSTDLANSGFNTYIFNPTDENITAIKTNGILFEGHFYKIKRILYGSRPAGTDLATIPADPGYFDVGEWDRSLSIDLEALNTAKVGDEIVFTYDTYTTESRDYCDGQIQYNWSTTLVGGGGWKDQTSKEYTLTEANISSLSAITVAKFCGHGVKVSAIKLIKHNVDYYLTSHSNIDFSKVPDKDVSVTFVRNFKSWNTLCLPFDWTIPGDFKNVYTYDSYDSETIYFNKVTSGTVSAGIPCLIEASDKQITLSATANIYNASPNTSGYFKGNYTPGASMEGKYGVAWSSGSKTWAFIVGSESSTAKAFSAYFEQPTASTRGFFGIETDDGTTSIKPVNRIEEGDGIMYGLDGKRLTNPKGLYIKNGKKYFAK